MTLQCLSCGYLGVTEVVVATVGYGTPAEIEYSCSRCGEYAYFAYGHYENNRFPFVHTSIPYREEHCPPVSEQTQG